MRGVGQRDKTECGCTALDGVRCTKYRVHGFAVGRLQIETQKALFHLGQQLIGFFKKGLLKLGNVHLMWVSRCGSTGCTFHAAFDPLRMRLCLRRYLPVAGRQATPGRRWRRFFRIVPAASALVSGAAGG